MEGLLSTGPTPSSLLYDCCQEGHTTRSCAIVKAEAKPEEISEDDLRFWSLIQVQDRPTTLHSVYEEEENEEEDGEGEEEGGSSDDDMDVD